MEQLQPRVSLALLVVVLAAVPASAQRTNLLQNPNADLEARHWRTSGLAWVEEGSGNRRFVVRDGGSFFQDVPIPAGAVGQYALFIGRGSSERINADGAITGLPYLYGFMMAPVELNNGRIFAYMQGQHMLCSAKLVGEVVKMWGIFTVPEGTGRIRFFLNQASRKDVPYNGSAARFDDLGLYLFPTEAEAKSFVDSQN